MCFKHVVSQCALNCKNRTSIYVIYLNKYGLWNVIIHVVSKIVSEYDQEIPQTQTATTLW